MSRIPVHNKIQKLRTILSLTVLLTLFLSIASPVSAAPVLTNEQRVTESPSIYYTISFLSMPQFPSYSNGKVVWKDDRNENADIYMYDFNTDTETQITTDSGNQGWPSISGDTIVWMDDRNGTWDIYMYDIPSHTETRVTVMGGDEIQPCISGDTIVFEYVPYTGPAGFSLSEYRHLNSDGSSDIYMYDIGTETLTPLVDYSGDQYSPWIDGNIVVWEDNRGTLSQIYYLDLSAPVDDGTIVSPSAGDQYWPTVTGNKTTWTEDRGEDTSYDIYAFNFTTETETQITNDPNIQAFGHISGNYIVWTDDREGTWDVFIENLTLGIEYPLVVRDAPQGVARIYGDRVIWGDSRNGQTQPNGLSGLTVEYEYSFADIYTGTLVDDTTPPTFDDLPDKDKPIDIVEGQSITTSPQTLKVKPTDTQSPIVSVTFKADGRQVCTDTTPDGNGLFECLWTVPNYCPSGKSTITIQIEATDDSGNTGILTRTVSPSVALCPQLADTGNASLGYIAGSALIGMIITFGTLRTTDRRKKVQTI